ncbi:MAG: hypothetical protein L3J26_13020 [Candidatus Polarisedimenticolaceae bacterium]|nr:hypothetical protein [Candidatus Polarisedimenticolaceae bacterium]
MRRVIVVVLIIMALMLWWLFIPQPAEPPKANSVVEMLGGEADAGFERAEHPRVFQFPQDHGAHPGFRSEWWYFTGNLETAQRRRFGFQLVFFRNALKPGAVDGESAWRSKQIWMAHFALTDAQSGRFHAYERFSRGAIGLAGAQPEPFEVWLDDWSVTQQGDQWVLHAAEKGLSLTLSLVPLRQPVLQGDAGLSQKSAAAGNASYYYSIPRLRAEGELVIGDQTHQVTGTAWLDREWSTSALGEDQAGWDWFSIQLDDGSDLMFYQLRGKDGRPDPHSSGSLLLPDGGLIRLGSEDVMLQPLGYWDSPKGGRYPVRWRLQIPSQGLDLEVTPVLENQELDLLVRYWEGAMDISGTRAGKAVRGQGYLELAGYSED